MNIPIKLIFIIFGVLGAVGATIKMRIDQYNKGFVDGGHAVQVEWDHEKDRLQVQADKDRRQRDETAKENQREVQKMLDNAAAGALSVQHELERMRQRSGQLAAMCAGAASSTSASGVGSGEAGDLQQRMFEWSSQRNAELARYADALQSDLQACRGQY